MEITRTKFRTLVERVEGRITEKNRSVEDIREGYDSLKRHGIDVKAAKEAIKWRKIGLAAYEAHTLLVAQYLHDLEGVQLDFFARAAAPVVLTEPTEDEVVTDGDAAAEDDGGADDGEADTGTMRPIGKIAAGVVETVAEMRRQNEAEEAIPPFLRGQDEPSQDDLVEAKLAGEAAGRQGIEAGMCPWPLKDPRGGWWLKAHGPAYAEWQAANPNVASINTPVARGKGPKSGFKDKTVRMPAAQAAKLLSDPVGEA